MSQSDFGLIGLAVMGQNLVLNVESRGFRVSVYNRTAETTEQFLAGEAAGRNIAGFSDLKEFVQSLARPRKVMIMVKAGGPVDAVIDQLIPLLEEGDVIIDGGNSHYPDTQRRERELREKNLLFVGTGVSGGEEGALKGPSIMPGGAPEAWEIVKPIFTKIAAVVDGDACCRHMGPDGAGHYVKMVHNGIEYGDMQLICEAYNILKEFPGIGAPELAEIFGEWNRGDLESYLIQITANIFTINDEASGKPIIDVIMDRAGQKGTGKWTVLSATELAAVISTINAAVEARILSSQKEARVAASAQLTGPTSVDFGGLTKDEVVAAVHDALFASKIISYAQGMDLLALAGKEHGWPLNFGDIATIWRGGCIIRAQFLNRIKEAYERDASLPNLMLDPYFKDVLSKSEANWRKVVSLAVLNGIPAPAFSASLAYYDSYRQERLPANLLQAQRDYFGAHTYERLDKPAGEWFHTEWPEVIE
ncbi:MAG: decarboxylating NADP(+)-dependent phosphogluconate dehydrogenase [Verrucomicrobiales bacterium]